MLSRRQLIASGTGLLLAGVSQHISAQDASQLQINSTRYISTNADTGAIFAQRGAHDQVAIASLTKVFTAMEAIQIAPLDTQITTTEDDYQPAEATVMGFGAGETFTLEELIYGMMLPSGNDAAYAIARSLGYRDGDTADEAVQRFMDSLNRRILAMGLQNTHLMNPDGWGVPGHYSSAADVASFMAYASGNDFLLGVMGTYRYTTQAGYTLVNTNRTLTTAPSVIGGKTGYDDDSGWCLVQIAQRDNTRIIAVSLDGIAPGDWYDDNLKLLDFGFEQQSALGTNPFGGEFVSWVDPGATLFAQAGSAEVTLSGETADDAVLVTREESAPVPIRIETEPEPEPVRFDGRRGNSMLAGIGATVLAGAVGAIRWTDFGGDRSRNTISPSIRSAGSSFRRLLPSLPSTPLRRTETTASEEDVLSDATDDQTSADQAGSQ